MTRFTLNGERVDIADSRDPSLLDVLRDRYQLFGARYGCGAEQCGSCRVLLDDRPVPACTTRLSHVDGASVVTVEGLADRRVIDALVTFNAGQCGYCLSGIAVSATALLARNPAPTRPDIQAALVPHLCRCGAHNRIIDAVSAAAATRRG